MALHACAPNAMSPPRRSSPSLPSLAALKARLQAEGSFRAVFMTGSGSTVVGFGSDAAPAFLREDPEYKVRDTVRHCAA